MYVRPSVIAIVLQISIVVKKKKQQQLTKEQ